MSALRCCTPRQHSKPHPLKVADALDLVTMNYFQGWIRYVDSLSALSCGSAFGGSLLTVLLLVGFCSTRSMATCVVLNTIFPSFKWSIPSTHNHTRMPASAVDWWWIWKKYLHNFSKKIWHPLWHFYTYLKRILSPLSEILSRNDRWHLKQHLIVIDARGKSLALCVLCDVE